MRISDVIGLLAALLGSTATLLAAWAYVRSQRPPRGELLRTLLTITIIMGCILGLGVLISLATTGIKINGQGTIPVPGFPAPSGTTPTPGLTPSPSPSPSPSPTLTPSPSSIPSPSPASTPLPSPTVNPTKTKGG